MDQANGDPNVGLNSDEDDGLNSEDKFTDHGGRRGIEADAGCPISDPNHASDDEG